MEDHTRTQIDIFLRDASKHRNDRTREKDSLFVLHHTIAEGVTLTDTLLLVAERLEEVDPTPMATKIMYGVA